MFLEKTEQIIKKDTFKLEKIFIFSVSLILLLNIAFFSFAAPIIAKTDANTKNMPKSNAVIGLLTKVSGKKTIYETISTNQKKKVKDIQKANKNVALAKGINDSADNKVSYTVYRTMTAYNSLPNQTDDSPCITANNFNVCEHGIEDTVAANFLKFNTKVRIPELFGNRVFYVRDRMNRRYPDNMDVWMLDYSDARKFGRRVAKIEILE